MDKAVVDFSRSDVNKAGEILRSNEATHQNIIWASEILGKWRAVHNYPIKIFQATLRQKLKLVDKEALIAQRLKRISSIKKKLRNHNKMELVRMQDIGGLRAVVGNIQQVNELHKNFKETNFKHELVSEKNYILNPKLSGYRSVHLVYKYQRSVAVHLIELQIRTRRQHAWATAVETMGLFLDYALKSSEGPQKWLGFFALTASAFARIEMQPPVPGYEHLGMEETMIEVAREAKHLQVEEKLLGFGAAINAIHTDKRKGTYYLLVLDPIQKTIKYKAYSTERFNEATNDYLQAEEIAKNIQQQVVLVSTESIEALRRAYPSFFLDTHDFMGVLIKIIDQAEKY